MEFLLRSFFDRLALERFFSNLFLNLPTPFAGEPWPQESVEQVGQEQHSRHPLVVHDGERQDRDDRDEPWN